MCGEEVNLGLELIYMQDQLGSANEALEEDCFEAFSQIL